MVILNRREHKLQKELTEEGALKCLMSGKMQVVHETSTEFLEPLVKSALWCRSSQGWYTWVQGGVWPPGNEIFTPRYRLKARQQFGNPGGKSYIF